MIPVGSIIETPGNVAPRLYSVLGVHLGGISTESVYQLAVLDRSKPWAGPGDQSINVPCEMLEAGVKAGVFTVTPAEPATAEKGQSE